MQESGTSNKPRVLVIASQASFLEKAAKALGDAYQVTATADAAEGLKTARTDRPDAIVLGHLEPRGSVFNVHGQLRDGWLTRNTPLIAVDFDGGGASNGWHQEDGVDAGDGTYLAVSTSETITVSTIKPASLAKAVADCLAARGNSFRAALLDPETFCVTWEQIPGRGAFEKSQVDAISNARRAARSGKIHGISITDNPGGNPAYATEMLGTEIKKLGIEPLVHLACRDKNRNEIESLLHGLTAADVRNVLVLTGDYPSNDGFGGTSKPVFDFDAVQALQFIDTLNQGLPHRVSKKKAALTATDFFAGACVSPFKITEAELMGQYYKLAKKIKAGAAFIISQVGYDARKLHEIIQWQKANGHDLPVMANIYVLPLGAARAMNRNGIPGCVATDKLVADIIPEAKAEDKGKEARLLRAAKMYAIAKGMGCAGAHIGGHNLSFDQTEFIIDKGEELSADWQKLLPEFDYPQSKGFYLFERDAETGLNSDRPSPRRLKAGSPLIYRFSRLVHKMIFEPASPFFKMLRPFSRLVDSRRGLSRVFGFTEHIAKVALYSCQNCGDCGLADVAYLCPTSQCPKNQRNAPCGGSYDGWCEVYPNEKKCIWVRAYGRLKHYGEEEQIGERIVPPNDWQLWETSSWLNFYLGRDHTAKRLGILPPKKKKEAEAET